MISSSDNDKLTQLISERDATSYTVQKDSFIMIDGKEINLKQGDNVYSIISKINNLQI